jgi:hypothetical protein
LDDLILGVEQRIEDQGTTGEESHAAVLETLLDEVGNDHVVVLMSTPSTGKPTRPRWARFPILAMSKEAEW